MLAVAVIACLFTGFRSTLAMFLLTFAFLFYLERLHRTKYLWIGIGAVILSAALLIPFAHRLPLTAQRTLAVLPLNLDFRARESATTSSEWRVAMWKVAVQDVPKYLFHGKGYALDPRLFSDLGVGASDDSWMGSFVAGDYHNGPLSLVIPFGIYGVITFIWFLVASMRLMYRYARFGNAALRSVNLVLLSTFSAKAVFFFFAFGALAADLAIFVGLVGFAIALNGPESELAVAEQPKASIEDDLNAGLLPST
jgi:hypothetical protein